MKVCFDVNALIYLYTNAPQQLEVLTAYDVVALRGFEACIPACALADINYILHHCGLRGEKLSWAMGALFEMFRVFDANEQDGLAAFQSEMTDFEDALIAHSAKRNGVDAILTYNTKDYVNSPVKALLPADFVALFKPDNVSYAELEFEQQALGASPA